MNKDDYINCLLAGLMLVLMFTLGLFIGGVRGLDKFLDTCTHYEDKTIVCVVNDSND